MTPPSARFSLVTALLALLLLPAAAPAAVVDADVETRQGTRFGKVTFTAAAGERNRLRITRGRLGFVFRDSANRVRARGDCRQVDRHTATCPRTEDIGEVRLRGGDDRAVDRAGLLDVRGGAGDDVLSGSVGVVLHGDAGDDVLRGGKGTDELTGGPGRDRLDGRRGDDRLADGERDGQAARDVFVGGPSVDSAGPDRGDSLSYATRRRALRIDLGRRETSTEDAIRGLETLIGGRGGDRLTGDGDDNQLEGGPGDDLLRGGRGQDIPQGGRGDDRVYGGEDGDVVWGDEGEDRLFGGDGADLLIGLEDRGAKRADDLRCGTGGDDARTDPGDTLTAACEQVSVFSGGVFLAPVPAIAAGSAEFRLRCSGDPGGCSGTLSLTGPGGEDFGQTRFALAPGATDAPVRVALTPAGSEQIGRGAIVQVDLVSDRPPELEEPGGYRVRLQASG